MAIVRRAAGTVATSTTTSLSVTAPSSAVGDLALLFISTSGTVASTPTGWALLDFNTNTTSHQYVYWTYLSATLGTTVVTMSAGTHRAVAVTYYGAANTIPFVSDTSGSGTAVASPSSVFPDSFVILSVSAAVSVTVSAENSLTGNWSPTEAIDSAGTSASLMVADGEIANATTTSLRGTLSATSAWSAIAIGLYPNLSATNPNGATPFLDRFQAANGTAISASNWTTGAGDTGGTFAIQNNQLALTTPSVGTYKTSRIYASGMTALTDMEVYSVFTVATQVEQYLSFSVRSDGGLPTFGDYSYSQNAYHAIVQVSATAASTVIESTKVVAGTKTSLGANVTKTITAGVRYSIRMQVQGQVFRWRVWQESATEPGTWDFTTTVTGTTIASGKTGINLQSGATAAARVNQIDEIYVTNLSIVAYTGTATLNGSGALSNASTPAYSANTTLSGNGSLAAGPPSVSIGSFFGLVGSGSLNTGTPVPAIAAILALSGTGSLSSTASIQKSGTATLTGSGALGALGAPSATSIASLSGNGALSQASTVSTTSSVALSGSGSLTFSGLVQGSSTATFSGSGSLTSSSSIAAVTTVTLSGSGTITTVRTAGLTGSANLNGSGSLSSTGISGFSGSAVLSGSGSLTSAASLTASTTATLTGSGSLASLGAGQTQTTVTLTGLGVLTSTTSSGSTGSSSLSGSGSLAVVTTRLSASGTSNLSGSGSLTSSSTITTTGLASTSGSGSLSSTGIVGYFGTAGLFGSGSIAASTIPGPKISTPLSGLGSLSVATSVTASGTVAQTGSGTLSVGAKPAVAIALALAGVGSLTSSGVNTYFSSVSLTGSGSLSQFMGPVTITRSVDLSGNGSLIAGQSTYLAFVDLSGSGSLASAGKPVIIQATASLSGAGALASANKPGPKVTVSLSGSGSLASLGLPNPTRSAPLSGSGSLASVQAAMSVKKSVDLAGLGTLSGVGRYGTAGTAALTGIGSLTVRGLQTRDINPVLVSFGGNPATGLIHQRLTESEVSNNPARARAHIPLSANLHGSPVTAEAKI